MKRVLIVDDEASIRALTASILEREGYETVQVEDGKKVLELLAQDQAFSFIISDIHMPRMNGLLLLGELRQCCPHIPVIISSVETVPDTVDLALDEGALYFLSRPFTSQQLMAAVHQIQNAQP